MRRCFLRTAAAVGSAGAPRPYVRVCEAIRQGGRGLLVAAQVFTEFEAAYNASTTHPVRSVERPVDTDTFSGVAAAAAATAKPLTAFCGSARDVEPLTIVLLKVLCDLRKLEEMRFLFTLCLLELEGQTPSAELFNVFLLAVSMTDTFNEHEVENVVELMRVKGVQPDIVTKLSLYMLYLRLGKESRVASWWAGMQDEVQSMATQGTTGRYPLLGLRLQHCFQTLVRLHYDVEVTHECLRLLLQVDPARCTPSLLAPYMVVGVLNDALTPAAVVEVLDATNAAAVAAGPQSPTAEPATPEESAPRHAPPMLSNEATAFRLLRKCARWKDPDSAQRVRAYLARYRPHYTVITQENEPLATLLHIEALAQSGRVLDAMTMVEAELPASFHSPGQRTKLFLERHRMTLLSWDPLATVVQCIAQRGTDGIDDVVVQLRVRQEEVPVARSNMDSPLPRVSAASLDLVMGACAVLHDPARAERLLAQYNTTFAAATPGPATYAALLQCYTGDVTSALTGVARMRALLLDRDDAPRAVEPTPMLLRAAMDVALAARDVRAALDVADLHVKVGSSIHVKQGAQLLQELTLLLDVDGVRRLLRAMRESKSPIERNSLARCTSIFQQWNIECGDLRTV